MADPHLHASRPAAGPEAVVAAATGIYLRCAPLDMSALATSLGIGRATLYRWVGNREDLLGKVLADAAERTFRAAARGVPGGGADYVVDVLGRFVAAVLAERPLQVFVRREPLLFIRLSTTSGAIESRVTDLVADLLEQEATAGRLILTLPAKALAGAVVRICDAHVYASFLGGREADVDTALDVVSLLLGAAGRRQRLLARVVSEVPRARNAERTEQLG
jgi:AcrR family transcriptional regulator